MLDKVILTIVQPELVRLCLLRVLVTLDRGVELARAKAKVEPGAAGRETVPEVSLFTGALVVGSLLVQNGLLGALGLVTGKDLDLGRRLVDDGEVMEQSAVGKVVVGRGDIRAICAKRQRIELSQSSTDSCKLTIGAVGRFHIQVSRSRVVEPDLKWYSYLRALLLGRLRAFWESLGLPELLLRAPRNGCGVEYE